MSIVNTMADDFENMFFDSLIRRRFCSSLIQFQKFLGRARYSYLPTMKRMVAFNGKFVHPTNL